MRTMYAGPLGTGCMPTERALHLPRAVEGRSTDAAAPASRHPLVLAHAPRSSKIVLGTVSERPKVQLSKSCVGESPPWVQIPPVPLAESPEIPVISGLSRYTGRGCDEGFDAAQPPA